MDNFALALSLYICYIYGMHTNMKTCGHRLEDKHFKIIRKFARKWRVPEAEALRALIEDYNDFRKEL